MPSVQLFSGDCLEVMKGLPGASVDACITDPPYGTTACAWDSVIPFAPMWANLKRVVKRNGAIVLFGSQPFTSALVMSNPQMFRYQWVWEKSKSASFLDVQIKPQKVHEDVCVFYESQSTFNPQKWQVGERFIDRRKTFTPLNRGTEHFNGQMEDLPHIDDDGTRFPLSIIPISSEVGLHLTQKPVELLRYLIRTYTQTGDTVLDFTMGSGTTGVACVIEGRNFIGIEKDEGYFAIAEARIKRAQGIPVDIPRRVAPERDLPLFRGEAVA